MAGDSFTTEFRIERSPEMIFDTLCDVRSWWAGEISGESHQLGDTFTYRHGDVHVSTQRVTEFAPGRRLVWHVDDARLNFVADPGEWIGTDVEFEIEPDGDDTVVRFTHRGLEPAIECYDACSSAWRFYVGGSLREAILSRA